MKADIFLLSKYVAICGEVNRIPETTPSITQKTKLWRGIKGTRGHDFKLKTFSHQLLRECSLVKFFIQNLIAHSFTLRPNLG